MIDLNKYIFAVWKSFSDLFFVSDIFDQPIIFLNSIKNKPWMVRTIFLFFFMLKLNLPNRTLNQNYNQLQI